MRNILYLLLTLYFISFVLFSSKQTFASILVKEEQQISDTIKVEIMNQQKVAENFLDSLEKGMVFYLINESKSIGEVIENVPNVLTKTFPNVIFFHITKRTLPVIKTLFCYYNGKKYSIIGDFNSLYLQMNHDNAISLSERIEALLLAYIGIDNSIEIESIVDNIEKIKTLPVTFNYKITAKINTKTAIYLLLYEDDRIVCITEMRGDINLGTLYYE